ncbi:hypothetical protein ACH42_05260 [Endozoicomonas sp. (ex Bugula neritina AB1)]|nr:hypothetical protein ACH42_05260 [Endozoicomonas sp. (ex Bugula neritina AB1)]
MDNELLLTDAEVFGITGYQKPTRQLRALEQIGVNAKINARGRVVVSRKHAEVILAGNTPKDEQQLLPNLDWMNS